MLTTEELDGKYRVDSGTASGGVIVVNGDGETEIRNGLTYRKDKNGFVWESVFTVVGPDKVQIESTVDPKSAPADKFLKDARGNLTTEVVTYRGVLDVAKIDGKLVMKGTIRHGDETTCLTLTKI